MSAWSRTTPPHTYACPQAPTSSLTTAERFLRSAAAYRWGGLAWGATAVRVQVQLPHREVGTVEVQGFEDSGCPASFTLRIILEPSVILSPSVSFWNPLYHFISLRIILDPPHLISAVGPAAADCCACMSAAMCMQEVFGMLETPRLAGGRVPLTLELLSPRGAPLQVLGWSGE